jgi:hypothetical protein
MNSEKVKADFVEKLYDTLREYQDGKYAGGYVGVGKLPPDLTSVFDRVHNAANEGFTALNQQPCEQQWVPVGQEPEEEGQYLAMYGFLGDTSGPFACTAEFFPEGNGDPSAWLIERPVSDTAEVIAWMPIPPYQEDSNR